jgi:hypothetical protein
MGGRGGAKPKKIYSQKKIRKKKIFPGKCKKKKFLAWKIHLKNFQPSRKKKKIFFYRCTKKILPLRKSPPPPITFLMVRP